VRRLRDVLRPFSKAGEMVKAGKSIWDAIDETDLRKDPTPWKKAAEASHEQG